jgi:hypothetical protein
VQLDGSFHDWLEGRGPVGCLMRMTDDATGRVYAQISKEETLWAKLGIKIIAASSPQAKGRVERTHGTNQDRLIKKLRLKGIESYEEMNCYLREHYLPAHNARFAYAPSRDADYHLPMNSRWRLHPMSLWCRDEERQLSKDGVISYESRASQVDVRHDMPVRGNVIVRLTEDGSLRVFHRSREGAEHELTWRDYKKPAPRPKREGLSEKAIAAHKARHPASNHPWRGNTYLKAKEAFDQRRSAPIPTEVP